MSDKRDERPYGGPSTRAAGYDDYSSNFSDVFFGPHIPNGDTLPYVVLSVQNIKRHFNYNPRSILEWGKYQKWAPGDPANKRNWNQHGTGSSNELFENWESAVEEAREDLAKIPVDYQNMDGADPDDPNNHNDLNGQPIKNLLQHLDTAVTIALMRKYMQGMSGDNTGIPVKVFVRFQQFNWRRHAVSTKWQSSPDRLEINMTCPNGGWIGTALWTEYDTNRHGKVVEYRARYTVPAQPTDHGQIFFAFNGLESLPSQTATPGILQPVLQWTNENHRPAWAVRSWYVPASYEPSFTQMPPRGHATDPRDFSPTLPAWTAATEVSERDRLEGVIKWDGSKYVSSMLRNGNEIARLEAPGIAALTYPVAVMEAYMPPINFRSRPRKVPKTGLVDIDMTNISIVTELSHGASVEPKWDVGKDDPGNPSVVYGNNRLKLYKVKADYSRTPITSLSFKAK